VHIRITQIDLAKIGQKRYKTTISLVNSMPGFVNLIHFVPRKYPADIVICENSSIRRPIWWKNNLTHTQMVIQSQTLSLILNNFYLVFGQIR